MPKAIPKTVGVVATGKAVAKKDNLPVRILKAVLLGMISFVYNHPFTAVFVGVAVALTAAFWPWMPAFVAGAVLAAFGVILSVGIAKLFSFVRNRLNSASIAESKKPEAVVEPEAVVKPQAVVKPEAVVESESVSNMVFLDHYGKSAFTLWRPNAQDPSSQQENISVLTSGSTIP